MPTSMCAPSLLLLPLLIVANPHRKASRVRPVAAQLAGYHYCVPAYGIQAAGRGLQESDEPGTAAHALHVRSHGAYAPGEQRRRPYDWRAAGIDPARFAFGATDKANLVNGVGKALNPELDSRAPRPPCIVPKLVEDHKLVNGDVLSQSRRLGGGDRGLPADFTYGRPSLAKVRSPCTISSPTSVRHSAASNTMASWVLLRIGSK